METILGNMLTMRDGEVYFLFSDHNFAIHSMSHDTQGLYNLRKKWIIVSARESGKLPLRPDIDLDK